MVETLRPFLLGLVLLNLLFVQLTGSVPTSWLLPLFGLTLASPWLSRLNERLTWRVAWNTGVLVVFALLVHHAFTTGLLHMLEDGLLLAALCQVHLLNNLGPRQRPDLMFFNSFLIAFITSFFCQDLGWSLAFVGYAALLLPSLQLHTVLRLDTPTPPGLLRAVLRDSLPRTVLVLLATGAAFAFWPRDFHREGWLGDRLGFGNGEQQAGLATEIRLDRVGPTTQGDAVVMRIHPADGDPASVPSHWRAITFVEFDGGGWSPYRVAVFASRLLTDPPWSSAPDEAWQRSAQAPGPELQVRLLGAHDGGLPAPLSTCRVALTNAEEGLLLDPKADGVLALQHGGGRRVQGQLDYTVRTGRLDPAARPRVAVPAQRVLLQLPRERLPIALRDLARTLRAQLPADAPPARVAEHFRAWLQDHRRYALPGADGFARNLGQFVLGSAAGHCEYFATTLALLLRTQDIPCRVAGGYLATDWDANAGDVVVRRQHAHAWVEALLPGSGWTTLDATPAAGLATDRGEQQSWLARCGSWLAASWAAITGFDQKARAALIARLQELPWDLVRWLRNEPVLAVSLAALLVLLLELRRRRRRQRLPASVHLWRRAVRRARLRPAPGETPRELLARAQASALPPARVLALAQATAAHEAARYASPPRTGTPLATH